MADTTEYGSNYGENAALGSILDGNNSANSTASGNWENASARAKTHVMGSILDKTNNLLNSEENAHTSSYNLKINNGQDSYINSAEFEQFLEIAQKTKLSNTQAQSLLDYGTQKNVEALKSYKNQIASWEEQISNDPELGGTSLENTILTANRAVNHFDASGELSTIMRTTGYGSHPAVLRFLYSIGKTLGEDNMPSQGFNNRANIPLEERLWRNWKIKS